MLYHALPCFIMLLRYGTLLYLASLLFLTITCFNLLCLALHCSLNYLALYCFTLLSLAVVWCTLPNSALHCFTPYYCSQGHRYRSESSRIQIFFGGSGSAIFSASNPSPLSCKELRCKKPVVCKIQVCVGNIYIGSGPFRK
jgi:hypothetical protein